MNLFNKNNQKIEVKSLEMIEPQSLKYKITFQGRMVKDIEILLNVNPMLLKTNVKRFRFPEYEDVPYTHEIIYIVRDWKNDQSMELRHTPCFEYGVGEQEFHPLVCQYRRCDWVPGLIAVAQDLRP